MGIFTDRRRCYAAGHAWGGSAGCPSCGEGDAGGSDGAIFGKDPAQESEGGTDQTF